MPAGARGVARRAGRRAGPGARGFLTQLQLVLPAGEPLSFHQVRVCATPARVWEALLVQDLASSPLSKALLGLRGYGGRAFRGGAGTFPEKLQRFGFTRLAELPVGELVFGLAGKFWRPDGGLRQIPDRAAFINFAENGCVKVAWNLLIGATDGVSCDLSTETRIEYFGESARRKFRLYWTLVGLFSGALRRSLLRGVKRSAEDPERARSL